MLASLSKNTLKQYDTALKKWFIFCQLHNIDFYAASVPKVMFYLTDLFYKGAKYGTLNSHRSALSLLIGSKIGTDDRINRLFKGFYKTCPPLPKYNQTWNPATVLNHVSALYPNDNLDLETLTKKVVTLIALVTAHRVQTISKIKLENILFSSSSEENEFISIKIPELIKTSRLGSLQPCLYLPFYKDKPQICPAEALKVYLEKTKLIRKQVNNLFISFKKPFKPVGSQTISRWIKTMLAESGIDTTIFTAHSTRHASTSAAHRFGVSIDTIRSTAGWSGTSSVFARFYQRQLVDSNEGNFALSVLNNE